MDVMEEIRPEYLGVDDFSLGQVSEVEPSGPSEADEPELEPEVRDPDAGPSGASRPSAPVAPRDIETFDPSTRSNGNRPYAHDVAVAQPGGWNAQHAVSALGIVSSAAYYFHTYKTAMDVIDVFGTETEHMIQYAGDEVQGLVHFSFTCAKLGVGALVGACVLKGIKKIVGSSCPGAA